MRVLMVIEKVTAFGYLIQEHGRAIVESGHELHIVFLTGPEQPDYLRLVPGAAMQFEQLPAKALRGLRITGIRHAAKLMRALQPDAVISHQFSSVVCCAVARLFTPKPYRMIGVFHGINAGKASSRRIFFRIAGKLIDRFVMVSNLQGENFRRHNPGLPASRFVTLHNIVDAQTMQHSLLTRQHARQQLGLAESAFVFGYVGRLNRKKGVYELIDAFEKLIHDDIDAHLTLLGDGPELQPLKGLLTERNLSDRIHVAGHQQDAWRLMPAFDVFVLPSYGESFGMVLVEAMVARVPIIATQAGAIPEVMGDSAIALCQAADSDSLHIALAQAFKLSAQQREQLTGSGWRRVNELFSYAGLKQGISELLT